MRPSSHFERRVFLVRQALALTGALAALAGGGWQAGTPLPVARTEVAAALDGNRIVVAGGYLADGSTTARVDLFDRLPAAGPDGDRRERAAERALRLEARARPGMTVR
jgi:hypothetical protein